jgi:hypothetical protein
VVLKSSKTVMTGAKIQIKIEILTNFNRFFYFMGIFLLIEKENGAIEPENTGKGRGKVR